MKHRKGRQSEQRGASYGKHLLILVQCGMVARGPARSQLQAVRCLWPAGLHGPGACAPASPPPSRLPFLPFRRAAVKGDQVNLARVARHKAGAGVLPEGPLVPVASIGRMCCDRAQPEFIPGQRPHLIAFPEIDRHVANRALAFVARQGRKKVGRFLSLGQSCDRVSPKPAGLSATGPGAAPVLPPPLWAFDAVVVEDSPFDPANARIRMHG